MTVREVDGNTMVEIPDDAKVKLYIFSGVVIILLSIFLFPKSGIYSLFLIPLLSAVIIYPVVLYIKMKTYFSSSLFMEKKNSLSSLVKEHNRVARYAEEIRRNGSFEIGSSTAGSDSRFAHMEDTSQGRSRRGKYVASLEESYVHNCSLDIVNKAKSDPLKYLMKYFNIRPNEESLMEVENLGDSISRLENAIKNLELRESQISESFKPPGFITTFYNERFMKETGVHLKKIDIPYPIYIFEYVSPGGNSSQKTTIQLTSEAIDSLISRMGEIIRFRKSAAGQRALMTEKLRRSIKERDGYTCQKCSLSVKDEPNLLLEIDHIIPLSRGGLSTKENLQVLCWRCNRSKYNKMPE